MANDKIIEKENSLSEVVSWNIEVLFDKNVKVKLKTIVKNVNNHY